MHICIMEVIVTYCICECGDRDRESESEKSDLSTSVNICPAMENTLLPCLEMFDGTNFYLFIFFDIMIDSA